MMAETKPENGSKLWIKFLKKHWKMVALLVAVIALAVIGAVLVYLWFVGYAQSIGLVPATLGLWTMGYLLTFILHVIFWEVLFIVIPLIIVIGVIFALWWKKLPAEERAEYGREKHFFGTRSRATSGGGSGISLLIFIVFCIIVYTDGNWDAAFANWTFDYLVYTCLWAFIWVLIIFGIPVAIGVILWISYQMKKIP